MINLRIEYFPLIIDHYESSVFPYSRKLLATAQPQSNSQKMVVAALLARVRVTLFFCGFAWLLALFISEIYLNYLYYYTNNKQILFF